jgi:hypothetical protein
MQDLFQEAFNQAQKWQVSPSPPFRLMAYPNYMKAENFNILVCLQERIHKLGKHLIYQSRSLGLAIMKSLSVDMYCLFKN